MGCCCGKGKKEEEPAELEEVAEESTFNLNRSSQQPSDVSALPTTDVQSVRQTPKSQSVRRTSLTQRFRQSFSRITQRKPVAKTVRRMDSSDAVPYSQRYEKSATSDHSYRSDQSFAAIAYIAIFNYTPGSKSEVPLTCGDKLRLMGDPAGDTTDPEWLFVMREDKDATEISTKKLPKERSSTGYVPRAFVAPLGSIETEPWYFGPITGREAENCMQAASDGSFLVRQRAEMRMDTPKSQSRKSRSRSGSKKPGGKSVSRRSGWKKTRKSDDATSTYFSKKAVAQYALTVKLDGKCHHRPIKDADGLFTLGSGTDGGRARFKEIPHLVNHYRGEDAWRGVLPCRLKDWPTRPSPTRPALSVEAQKHWQEIPRNQIKQLYEIGEGHFGVVWRAEWRTSDAKINVAVKALKKGSWRARRRFMQEAITMKSLSHKNLVKLYGIVSDKDPYWIITEFVKDGSLREYLIKRKQAKKLLNDKHLVHICAQIADGMRYLESKHVIHRDLAARNVLVEDTGDAMNPILQVKVADFGLAQWDDTRKEVDLKKSSTGKRTVTVPTKWTAPEALAKGEYSSASDVWSFGIVVHEVFTHAMEPYGIFDHKWVREKVKQKVILQKSPDVPEKVYGMMKKCFQFEPKARPHFDEIYKCFDSYFRAPGQTSIGD